jgi:hypothetical protein
MATEEIGPKLWISHLQDRDTLYGQIQTPSTTLVDMNEKDCSLIGFAKAMAIDWCGGLIRWMEDVARPRMRNIKSADV